MYRGQSFKVRKISEENKDPSDGIVIHEKKVFPTPEDFDKYQKRRESNNKAARNSRARKMQATQAIITDNSFLTGIGEKIKNIILNITIYINNSIQ